MSLVYWIPVNTSLPGTELLPQRLLLNESMPVRVPTIILPSFTTGVASEKLTGSVKYERPKVICDLLRGLNFVMLWSDMTHMSEPTHTADLIWSATASDDKG